MLRNGYGTYRESDKNGYTDKKQSKTKGKPKENTQKKKPYTAKSKPKEQAIQQQTEKYPYPQPKQKTKNYTYQKETTGVLHPASRLTPGNGGIPPFLRVILINVRVLTRYR